MEFSLFRKKLWATGLAMFSMFFGAGNIVFPLVVGKLTQDQNLYAVLGMVLTGVLVPLAGLLAMILFEGDTTAFFRRIGRVPGFILSLLILALIGPLAGLPRCITISFSTLSAFGLKSLPGMNLPLFSLINCIVIFLFTFRRKRILDLLGYVLTPLLLLSLGAIIVKSSLSFPEALPSFNSSWGAFTQGIVGGYNTMDLLAAFFFSSIVLVCLKEKNPEKENKPQPSLLSIALVGSIIAASLLGFVYLNFAHIAAKYSIALANVPNHELLGAIARSMLGPYAGLVAGVAVTFACLTTEIALAVIFAQFVQKFIPKVTFGKFNPSYEFSLIGTLLIAFLVSTLHFDGISTYLVPFLQLCYPSLIVLTVLNICHKLFGFKPVKFPVYGVFLVTVLLYFVI